MSFVTKCKDEFKNASNPVIIAQRREEKRREEKRREEKRREEKRRFLRNYAFQNIFIKIRGNENMFLIKSCIKYTNIVLKSYAYAKFCTKYGISIAEADLYKEAYKNYSKYASAKTNLLVNKIVRKYPSVSLFGKNCKNL